MDSGAETEEVAWVDYGVRKGTVRQFGKQTGYIDQVITPITRDRPDHPAHQ